MNEIIISNIDPQNIVIGEGGTTGITTVYVNGVDVTVGNVAYVVVPTKTSELQNDSGYITQEQDPTVPYYIKQIKLSDINNWNNKQNQLVSGQNIKTINNESLLGSGNINVDTSYTAGTGIQITDENVINNTITSYDDLSDLPTIPTKTSELQNDSDYVTSNALSNVAFSGSYLDLSNTPDLSIYATLDTKELLNYFTKDYFFKILPKLTGTGSNISLSPTVDGTPIYLSLGASELTQDGTPTPNSPQDIHTISGSNKVVAFGKQYIDNTNLSYNYSNVSSSYNQLSTIDTGIRYKTTYNNGSPVVVFRSVDLTNYVGKTIRFKANFGTKGRITLAICNEDASRRTTIQASTTSGNIITYVVPNNLGEQKYLAYYLGIVGATGNDTEDFTNLILTIDNEDMTYEPYVSQEADIDLGDLEYSKIGNYSDEFIRDSEGNWQLKKNIGKYTIPNNAGGYNSSSNWFYIGTSNFANINSTANTPLASTHFENINLQLSGNENVNGIWNIGTHIVIRNTALSSAGDYQTFFTNNNVIMYSPLATPTYTQITGTLANQLENVHKNMLSQAGQTNISQVNNDLAFTITATTLKDLSSY